MVGGGLGPGPAWPLGGGGHRMAEILFGESTLQGEEEGLARGILNFNCSYCCIVFLLCVIYINQNLIFLCKNVSPYTVSGKASIGSYFSIDHSFFKVNNDVS